MDEKATRLMKRFVPKLSEPQMRALRMLAVGACEDSGNWREGTIHSTAGHVLVSHKLAESKTTFAGFTRTTIYSITELGRIWLELKEITR